MADLVFCVFPDFRQVSLVVNAEQTEVTDISIEVRERLVCPLLIMLTYFLYDECSAVALTFGNYLVGGGYWARLYCLALNVWLHGTLSSCGV